MIRRELLSLAVCLLIALLILGIVFLFLNYTPPANAASVTPQEIVAIEEAADTEVLVELMSEPEPSSVDLTTDSEGKKEEIKQPQEEPEEQPEEEPEPEEPPEEEDLVPEEELQPEPIPVEPPPEVTDGEGDQPLPTFKGIMPPFEYRGKVAELKEKYPRLEMVWVMDREPDGPDGPAVVMMEAVRDVSSVLYYHNSRTGDKSHGFDLVTMRYDTDQRVHVADPSRLYIWDHRHDVLKWAGLPIEALSRLKWGYYRHRVEVYHLQKAKQAYIRAERTGKVKYQPERGSSLRVTWGFVDGEPCIEAVEFCPKGGAPIPLDLK